MPTLLDRTEHPTKQSPLFGTYASSDELFEDDNKPVLSTEQEQAVVALDSAVEQSQPSRTEIVSQEITTAVPISEPIKPVTPVKQPEITPPVTVPKPEPAPEPTATVPAVTEPPKPAQSTAQTLPQPTETLAMVPTAARPRPARARGAAPPITEVKPVVQTPTPIVTPAAVPETPSTTGCSETACKCTEFSQHTFKKNTCNVCYHSLSAHTKTVSVAPASDSPSITTDGMKSCHCEIIY